MFDVDAAKREMGELLKTFQFAIVDLYLKIKDANTVMTKQEVEDVNYVIGVVTMNSVHLERLISHKAEFFAVRESAVREFMGSAKGFAQSLCDKGLGFPPSSD